MFIDERLVEEHAGVLVSTHVTRESGGRHRDPGVGLRTPAITL